MDHSFSEECSRLRFRKRMRRDERRKNAEKAMSGWYSTVPRPELLPSSLRSRKFDRICITPFVFFRLGPQSLGRLAIVVVLASTQLQRDFGFGRNVENPPDSNREGVWCASNTSTSIVLRDFGTQKYQFCIVWSWNKILKFSALMGKVKDTCSDFLFVPSSKSAVLPLKRGVVGLEEL